MLLRDPPSAAHFYVDGSVLLQYLGRGGRKEEQGHRDKPAQKASNAANPGSSPDVSEPTWSSLPTMFKKLAGLPNIQILKFDKGLDQIERRVAVWR